MRAWVDLEAERAGEALLWDTGRQLGDWLDPSAPPDRPCLAATDSHLVATAYLARSAELRRAGGGRCSAARTTPSATRALADGARRAFNREYVSPAGRVASDSQTGYALALAFDLLETDEQRARAGGGSPSSSRSRATASPRASSARRSSATRSSEAGELGAAYALLLQRECPSWLYSVTMGATTVWERWDSLLPGRDGEPGRDDVVQPLRARAPWPTGCTARWPAWRPPRPGTGGSASARGPAAACATPRPRTRRPTAARRCGGSGRTARLEVDVLVPPNTTARVELPAPDHDPVEVGSGTHRFSIPFPAPEEDEQPVPLSRVA